MVPSRHRLHHLAAGVAFVFFFAAGQGLFAQQTGPDGWINEWLIYPPILSGFGNSPGEDNIRLDYITDDEEVFESTMLPTEAFEVEPDYFGAAAGQGLANEGIDFPEFALQVSPDDTMNFVTMFGESANSMTHSVVYVNNPQEVPISTVIELASDDSVQVKVDDCEVHINNIGRGPGGSGTVQDRAPAVLEPGAHRVLVKVFQGGGDYAFRLRFTNAATGEPLTAETDPAIEIAHDPDDFGLDAIEPIGMAVVRSIDPRFIARISETDRASVTLTGGRLLPDLDSAAPVGLTEFLPEGLSLVANSADPAPTSVSADGRTISWETDVATVEAGVSYEISIAQAGDHDISGTIEVGDAPACTTGGRSRLVAKDLAGILLGDVVGGGDGISGGNPPPYKAIDTDNGKFMDQATVDTQDNNRSEASDPSENLNPAPVLESDVINSVFFFHTIDEFTAEPLDLGVDEMYLSVDEDGNPQVPYKFIDGDAHEVSWNGILSNNTHDRDKTTPDNRAVFVGGSDAFATGVGVHASAGITFDLDGMRDEYGAENIDLVTGTMGMDECNGHTNLYIIFSDDEGVVPLEDEQDPTVNFHDPDIFLLPNQRNTSATFVVLKIPEEARYMSFVTGDAGDGIGCDHGVFGDMRILSENDLLSEPTNLACSVGETGLELTWEHRGNKDEPFEISANGQSLAEVSGDALSHTLSLASLPAGVLEICVSNGQGSACCGFLNADQVHINSGGRRLESFMDGRTWEEDSSVNPSVFLVEGPNTADFTTGFNPAFPDRAADTSLVEPDFRDDPNQSRIFATERWNDGDVIYRIPALRGDYEVTLLFAEGCCSGGCEDIANPANSLGGCRVFDIEINGAAVETNFSQHVEASRGVGISLPNSTWGIALAKGPYLVEDVNLIEVAIRDLGPNNPPENASIKGISIVRRESTGASLRPGDVNFDRNFNIADAVAHLGFQFGGGAALNECLTVPDSDPPQLNAAGLAMLDFNGDGMSNIADAVGMLNRLFSGGDPHVLGEACAIFAGTCESLCE